MNPNDSESDESELSQESEDEDESSDNYKKISNSAQKKNNFKPPASKFVEEDDNDNFIQTEPQAKNYIQPPIQRVYSESSDLFADTPQSNSKGIKRMHEDEDYSSGTYKRFKH